MYVDALWLTSHLLGARAAILMGCAAKKRDLPRLRSRDYAQIIFFIAKEIPWDALKHWEVYDHDWPANDLDSTVPTKRKHLTLDEEPNQGKVPIIENQERPAISEDTEVISQNLETFWRKTSNAAKTFFNFLCELGHDDIPEILVLRMMKQNEGWDCNGRSLRTQIPRYIHIFDDLVSGKAYDFTLMFLMKRLILEKPGEFDRTLLVIPQGVRKIFAAQGAPIPHLEWQRLVLVSHAFPGRLEEPWFADTGRVLLPQLQAAIRKCPNLKSMIIENPFEGFRVLLALILSSKIPGTCWKVEALTMATDILDSKPGIEENDTTYLQGLLELRKRDISRRLEGIRFDTTNCEGATSHPIDPRSNSICGAILRSQAQDCIMSDPSKLKEPVEILGKFNAWDPFNPSEMEQHELNLREFFLVCGHIILRLSANYTISSKQKVGHFGLSKATRTYASKVSFQDVKSDFACYGLPSPRHWYQRLFLVEYLQEPLAMIQIFLLWTKQTLYLVNWYQKLM
ncbi:hypothetical protein NUU61_001593 [Penicillium alfredii]|uniref:Uncharacterized protein n=1 Tax=Penicillium alfredii TaxID=1506179 RepID=A0A9W9G1E5_9EURO|nr:uncharacterized protein NUU61_001593 [Penicillium alfredii]KAJ5110336.1 hypothetical protein NUU61_001593 [Penicillium alfredii]